TIEQLCYSIALKQQKRVRTQTLLKEYKERDKSNVFKDKRFGEYDTKISPEEKMMKRFAMERQQNYGKKSIYNLNEDEELTHYGQSLADIEKLNDIVDSDSDDTEEKGILSAELTAAHFGGGGGLLRRKAPMGQQDEEEEKPKSRKELIEELITKSKQEKRERQMQRENAMELTEKLDSEWKDIQALLAHKTPKSERTGKEETPKPDEYDKMVRELGFEMKAQPSDRMKTEEEFAKEEQERLQKLEADRLRRMHGIDEQEKKKPKHMSADDLADGFILDKDDRCLLTIPMKRVEENQEEDGENGGNEREEESEPGSEDAEEATAEEIDAIDSHSDLESDTGSDEEASENEEEKKKHKRNKKKLQEEVEQNAKIEAARSELPYTFAAPESYEKLKSLLSGRTMEQQLVVLERIQKCNHPSLEVGNKAKLEKLFGFLLEYIGELATVEPPEVKTIDKLVLPLYHLCQMFPDAASNSVKLVFQDAAHDMEEMIEVKGRAAFPVLDMLIYLKITKILFPASDYWHPVVTPALVYMSQLLTKCPIATLQDVVKGLFVCCLFLDYVSLSQRFAPELINFLLGILHIATPKKGVLGYTLVHPFRPLGKNSEQLLVQDKEDMETWQKQNLPLHIMTRLTESSKMEMNHIKLSCIALCFDLIKRCAALYGLLPSFHEIMQPIRGVLTEHLPVSRYPKHLQLENKEKHYYPLVCEKKKPVPLKLYTPKIVKVLEFGRKQGANKEEQERQRLIHKHKREFKGAVREIRKDNQFLARMQLSETMDRDADRKRRVKQLFNSLATQEGEWKAMKRKKFKR
uniref:NOP14 nucleolar protein n=1 Tax=Sphenodon punctatus TaxID=8508 RepID=A0A8D0HBP7_SPHPU